MRNLLWQHDVRQLSGRELDDYVDRPESTLHWYDKRDAQPWRKMGHITALGDTIEAARKTVDRAEELVDQEFSK